MGERLQARQGNRVGILFCESSSYPDLMNAYQLFLERRTYRAAALAQLANAIAPQAEGQDGGRHAAHGATDA